MTVGLKVEKGEDREAVTCPAYGYRVLGSHAILQLCKIVLIKVYKNVILVL